MSAAVPIGLCVLGLLYPYVVYPLLLMILGKEGRPNRPLDESCEDFISCIVPVHNAVAELPGKLANLERCRYPRHKVEFLFVSDASDDGTDELLARTPWLIHIRLPRRVGKEEALRVGIGAARGDVLCFSDVGTHFDGDVLQRFGFAFREPGVGAVSSVDRLHPGTNTLERLQSPSRCGFEGGRPASRPPWE